MTKTDKYNRRRPKNTRETWWLTVSPKLARNCKECGEKIPALTVYAYLPLSRTALCEDCFAATGLRAKISERLRILRGEQPWKPNKVEDRLLEALADGPLSAAALAERTEMHPGKVRGLLGHLKARRRVVKTRDDEWDLR
jgi:hypothetical protein